jgi:RecB family exonuclease
MIAARESEVFTRFDGNLAGAAGLPALASGEHAVSPTALERYAICPHEYFMRQLLRVSPVEDPDERVEISVLDVGTIIHESFDALIREAADEDRLPGYGQPWSDAQRARLQEIGARTADEFQSEGKTGHPLLWARQRASILATLDWMVTSDNAWRAEQDARVVASELSFGRGEAPAVVVPVADGSVTFRGSADKVDERRDGTILVTDIKSGSARKFKDLSEQNPVAKGEKLQLPVYAHAARDAHGQRDSEVEAQYWFVGRKDRGTRIEVPLTDAVEQTYAATVGLLASSIARGAFPQRAPEKADWRQDWVQCAFCNPDGLGHAAARRRWEAKRLAPELAAYTALVEPDAVQTTSDHGETSTQDSGEGQR